MQMDSPMEWRIKWNVEMCSGMKPVCLVTTVSFSVVEGAGFLHVEQKLNEVKAVCS